MPDPGEHREQGAARPVESVLGPHALRAAVSGFSAAITGADVAASVFEQARALFGATGGSIAWRTSPDTLRIVHAHGEPADAAAALGTFPVSASLPPSDAVRTGATVLLANPEEIASRYPDLAEACRARGDQAWITVPLRVEGRSIGALGLTFARPSPLDPTGQALLHAIASECAAALARARRYEEERTLREAAERYAEALGAKALELARVQEALREQVAIAEEQTALLEQLFQASMPGLALADAELRFVKVNPAYRSLTPHPELDPVGRTFEEVWSGVAPASGSPIVGPGLAVVLQTGAPLHVDAYEAVFPDGSVRHFSSHVSRVQHGGRPALLGALWETTSLVLARRAAEAAAAGATRTAAELDAVLAAIPAGVIVYDPEGRILRMNAAAEALMDYAPGERNLPARERSPAFRLIGGDGRPLPVDATPVMRALRGETVPGETYARAPARQGGPTTWLTVSAAPVRDPAGNRVGAVAAVFDVTTEHGLLEMREDLLRMVSHDLRTPLHAVLMHAHLIRRTTGVPERIAERADAIVRTSERMAGMLQDLGEMVLLESGHLPLARVPVDLRSFLRDVLHRLAAPLPPDRIQLAIEDDVPLVDADPGRIERVVVNLLSNALKYSAPETPVEVSVASTAGGDVEIAVVDHGVGIPPEDVTRIFGRFYRVAGARQPEGLGLGLYIARLIVEAHGGHVAVQSTPGRGSRFTVHLPPAPAAGAT
ncbi:sensor histidine kinase [Anaeromyxobacter oryzae]|uniref:histidine kinase n=1 Tax=Anaeromyxobacter oryzae TaxID=2918170 RepID=A0ABN6MYP4_9BACT|nr:ATP-binding protein [Anaeromyxobacter oryzae]BDG05365.1 hypothetical protein AMOR_43610 [Anaeromyxobacter oryzae]